MFFSISSFLLSYVWALDVCFVVTLGFVLHVSQTAQPFVSVARPQAPPPSSALSRCVFVT